jgi:hypothetical protein
MTSSLSLSLSLLSANKKLHHVGVGFRDGLSEPGQFSSLRFTSSTIAACESPAIPAPTLLQETVVPELPARDGLIIGISGRFRDTGQQSLDERIDEREKSLLPQLDATDLAGQAVETCGNPCFRRINTALTTRQLPFDGSPHERGRTGEATVLSCALDAPDQQLIDSQSATHCLSLW